MVEGCGEAVLSFEQNHALSYVQKRMEEKIVEYSRPQRDPKLQNHPVRVDFEAMINAIIFKVRNFTFRTSKTTSF